MIAMVRRKVMVLSMLLFVGAFGGCKASEDCIDNCACSVDLDCKEREYCNAFGSCQPRPKCRINIDCPAEFICDSVVGECVPQQNCARDMHCSLGQICQSDAETGVMNCVEGCRDHGDCPLGAFCSQGSCTPSSSLVNEVRDCTACPGETQDSSYCDFGEICNADGACVDAPGIEGLCDSCDPESGVMCPPGYSCVSDPTSCTCVNERCVGSGQFCQRDSQCATNCELQRICVSACGDSSQCPSGFECENSRSFFTTCETDADCEASPLSTPPCLGSSESGLGYCPVASPSSCLSLNGRCNSNQRCERLTGGGYVETDRGCLEDAHCEYVAAEVLVDNESYFVCERQYGHCSPQEGLRCDGLSDAQAPCATFEF